MILSYALAGALLGVGARAALVQTQVDLTPFSNNKAAAVEGQMANFDGHDGSYPAEYLPQETLTDASINVRDRGRG